MKLCRIPRRLKTLSLVMLVSVYLASQLHATVITWNLNPSSTESAVDSTMQSFTSSGDAISAAGYMVGFSSTPLGLYDKNGGDHAIGLGVTSTSDHEMQGNGFYSTQFIQRNVSSLLGQDQFISIARTATPASRSGRSLAASSSLLSRQPISMFPK